VKVDAKAVGVFINSGQLSGLAVFGTCKSDTCPSGIDMQPYGRVALLDCWNDTGLHKRAGDYDILAAPISAT
jgi:hypothetical protein